MAKIEFHPYSETDSPFPESDRVLYANLLSRIFDELPPTRATWAATLALGLPRCAGMTTRHMAQHARCTEAELISHAIKFAANIHIKASPHLRAAVRNHLVSGELRLKTGVASAQSNVQSRELTEEACVSD